MNKTKGFTLIELIVFIVTISIVASTILVAFITVVRSSPLAHRQVVATQTATTCLEWFIGQRTVNGFSNTAANCTSTNSASPSTITPTFCTNSTNTPAGYSTVATCYADSSSNPTFKTITITTNDLGSISSTLSILLANY